MSEPDIQKGILALATMSLGAALEATLKELAKHHGAKSGPWLDELQLQFVNGVKRSRSEGLSDTAEFKIMDGAIALINMYVNAVRTELDGTLDENH